MKATTELRLFTACSSLVAAKFASFVSVVALGVPRKPGAAPLNVPRYFIGERNMVRTPEIFECLLDSCARPLSTLSCAYPVMKMLTMSRGPTGAAGQTGWAVSLRSLRGDVVDFVADRRWRGRTRAVRGGRSCERALCDGAAADRYRGSRENE